MKWARFRTTTTSTAICGVAGGGACGDGGRGASLLLGPPSHRGWVDLLIIPCYDRSANLPKAIGFVSALF